MNGAPEDTNVGVAFMRPGVIGRDIPRGRINAARGQVPDVARAP